jgi:hypothetical protein
LHLGIFVTPEFLITDKINAFCVTAQVPGHPFNRNIRAIARWQYQVRRNY